MTLDDALNELGIDHIVGADGARRAYLRLLKKRKPEVDRDGFMRLREAYEIAKPYFEEVELCRVVDAAMDAEAARPDGGREVVRLETPAGVVFLHRAPPIGPDEPSSPDEPWVEQEKPFIGEDNPAVADTVEALEPPIEPSGPADEALPAASEEPVVESVATVPEAEPSEPSIDELIAAGKFKKAARLMGSRYREAVQQGTIDVAESSPYQAVLLLLRLHEKNRLDEARMLEKEFAAWLASTGASVRLMAGPVGVMWLMVRELSALSNKFPKELREGIAKAVIAGKLDDAQRRAGWFQLSDADGARNAALDLHAHAPTLAKLVGEELAPTQSRVAPSRTRTWPFGNWGIGIVLVGLLNLFRLLGNSPTSTPNSYRGQSDPAAYYRSKSSPSANSYALPNPSSIIGTLGGRRAEDDSLIIDSVTREKMSKVLAQLEITAGQKAFANERLIIQRALRLRQAIDKGSCDVLDAELNGFAKDMALLSDPLKAALLPDAKKLVTILRDECVKATAAKAFPDGGNKKP